MKTGRTNSIGLFFISELYIHGNDKKNNLLKDGLVCLQS